MVLNILNPESLLQNQSKGIQEGNIRTEKHLNIGGISGSSFSDMISEAIQSVDQAQKTAEAGVQDIVAGKSENIHEAMIAMEKAQLSFQLMVEIRNRAMETYQELSRMQL